MSISLWWPRLRPETRAWLIDNNGDVVAADILDEIMTAGGDPTSGESWVGTSDQEGFHLSDEAIDWVEAVANGEDPDAG